MLLGMKVFVSYQMTQQEQVLAWRLQTIGSTYGITVFVPPPTRRRLTDERAKQMNESDALIAFIMQEPSQVVLEEIKSAQRARKPIIPIVKKGIHVPFRNGTRVFEFDPNEITSELENQVFDYLKSQRKIKNANLIKGIAGLGVLLLSLYALTKTTSD